MDIFLDIADVLPRTGVKSLNIGKNFLGDEALKHFADKIVEFMDISRIAKLEFSSSRVGDEGILYFLQELKEYPNLT